MALTNEQKQKLLDYAVGVLAGKPVGSFRHLVYSVMGLERGIGYSVAHAEGLLDVNNALLQLSGYIDDLAKEKP